MTACLSRKDMQCDHLLCHVPSPTEADVLANFGLLSARQAMLTMEQLCEMQSRWMGPVGTFAKLTRQVREQGRQAPMLAEVTAIKDKHRKAVVEQAVQFVLGILWRREPANNPFSGKQREYLCCVVFDELADYTTVERYAASAALRQCDGDYFSKLIATTRNTVERRIVFHGLLEHFDSLLPVERSVYPINYRAAQQQHLANEESLYGKLTLDRSVRELLEHFAADRLLARLGCVKGRTV
ncbi:hypothetical protein [Pseudomonas sp. v388]|uniref:hypothetical protein n=1 Tax=Pseudomonas sp. v388 TaxID=2479849 RepID=UPI0021145567|nr:hypothetical protein [Pseudomonas sp. v388]